MLRVAVLIDNTLQYDRRALQELETLSQLHIDLTVYCNTLHEKPNNDSLNGITLKRVFTDDHWQWKHNRKLVDFANGLVEKRYDVLHCHDHFMLHIGALVKKKRPETILIYESRELFYSYPIHYYSGSALSNFKSRIVRGIWVRREQSDARLVDHLITVNDSIAGLLKKRFNLHNEPVVFRNIGPLRIPERNNLLRNALKIEPTKKIIVYAGYNVYPNALGLESLVQQIANKQDYALVIIATNNARRKHFERTVEQQKISNVFFHDVVPVEQVELYLAGCDVGILCAWDRKNLSYWYALDNKLFTYVMAGLPVLATAQPEYENVVKRFNIGVCVNPEEANGFENALVELEKNADTFRLNAEKARLTLNWENEKQPLVSLYQRLTS